MCRNSGYRWKVCFGALFAISLLFNIICLFQRSNNRWSLAIEQNSDSLREIVFQNASISSEDMSSFMDSIVEDVDISSIEVFALIPPFACSDCILASLEQLNQLQISMALLVPEGSFSAILPEMRSSISILHYCAPETQNPVLYYPDLVIVVTRNNRMIDFFLHTKDVPHAMTFFLNHLGIN